MNITSDPPRPVSAPTPVSHSAGRPEWLHHLCWAASLFFVGLAGKLFLIFMAGTSLPYLDQWDGEANSLFIPFFDGRLSFADLFHGHGQHRIFFTRICALGLLLLNGRWDNQVEMVFNAVVHCLGSAGFGWMMAKLIGRRSWPFIWLALVLALILPFAWENTLWGFQSQFYFLLFFSILVIRWLALEEPLSGRWWLGAGCAVAAVFTMASGFLAAVAAGSLVVFNLLKERSRWQPQVPTLAFCGVLTVAGFLVQPFIAPSYELQAHTPGEFFRALGMNLAWPWDLVPLLAPLNLFPLAVLAWVCWRSRKALDPAERMVLGIGGWVIMQSLVLSYGRAFGGRPPAARYMDILSYLMVVNVMSIVLVLSRHRRAIRIAPVIYAGFAAWAMICAAGLWRLNRQAWRVEVPAHQVCQQLWEESMRAFVVTDQTSRLALPGDCLYLPIVHQAQILRHPAIRRILPACLHDPVKVVPAKDGVRGFATNGIPTSGLSASINTFWGSFSGDGASAKGTFESLPIRVSGLPYLEIPVAGNLGEAGLSLELAEVASGAKTVITRPRVPETQWANVRVKAPAGEFKIVARDESATGWLAFQEPREVGRLSMLAVEVLVAWKYFLATGVAALSLGVVLGAGRQGFSTKSASEAV